MKTRAVLTLLVALSLAPVAPALAQSSDELKALRDEIKALKEGQTAIQKELQEIKNLLRSRQGQPQARPEFKEAVINIDSSYFKGKNDAKVVFIEFSDYQ